MKVSTRVVNDVAMVYLHDMNVDCDDASTQRTSVTAIWSVVLAHGPAVVGLRETVHPRWARGDVTRITDPHVLA